MVAPPQHPAGTAAFEATVRLRFRSLNESSFPVPTSRVVATVAELFRLQDKSDLAEVLATSDAKIEATDFDNWNGGTTIYTLYLNVPLVLFARIEGDLPRVESEIASKVQRAIRNTGNDVLSTVVISPFLEGSMPNAAPAAATADSDRLWDPAMLRLFISHVSANKVEVAHVKRELRLLGVSGFVAHQDIEPSLEWQGEIELALASMHAMAALLTPEFHTSSWTDQEVGVAVARGVLVIPVRLGLDPYGFIARKQGLSGDLAKPGDLAADLVQILARRQSTGAVMREGLVVALEESSSFAASSRVTTLIETARGFTEEQLARMEAAIQTNSQVGGSWRVPGKLQFAIAKHRSETPTRTKASP